MKPFSFSLLLFIAAVAISCKKETEENLYLKLTLDGTEYTMTEGLNWQNNYGSGGGGELYTISYTFEQPFGDEKVLPTFTIIYFQKWTSPPTHAERATMDDVGGYEYYGHNGYESYDTIRVLIQMLDKDSVLYQTKGDTIAFDPTEHSFEVTSEEFTEHNFSDIVEGSFNCVLYKQKASDPGVDSYKVTNGTFRSRTWQNE